MTQQVNLERYRLAVGDYVGFPVLADGIDDNDFIIWCAIKKVEHHQGVTSYHVVYPDGKPKRTPTEASFVRFWRRGMVCEKCDVTVPTTRQNCQ